MNNWKKTLTIIWTGQIFSTLTSSIVGYAAVFYLSIKTGSAEVLAFATIAALLPQLIFGVFTGVLIDRWDRRKTMMAADSFIAICSAVLGLLFIYDKADTAHIYVLLALRSFGAAFHQPAMQASMPLLAPESELMRIAGVNQIIFSFGTIAGPAMAAVFISMFDMAFIMFTDVAGAVIACVALIGVRVPNPEKSNNEAPPNMRNEIKEGLSAIYSHQGLFWIFIFMMACMFFLMPIAALFPLMTLNHFSGDTYMMSYVEVSWGVGTMIGGALLGLKVFKINRVILLNCMYLILGLTIGFSGVLSPDGFVFFLILTFICGIGGAFYNSSFTVILQTTVEPNALGRVFSIYGSLTLIPSMFGLLATGFVADSIGVNNSFILAGIAFILIGLLSVIVPSIKLMMKDKALV